jgi:pyrroloquinoline quinone biosynthesis protein E
MMRAASQDGVAPPLAMLAELTHRCPLACPYCSNPLQLERASAELDTATWCRVLDEAARLGVLQVHFSGGEPLVRRDLADLVRQAHAVGLYSNLITSGIGLTRTRLEALAAAGLEHVQLSLQDSDEAAGDFMAHRQGAQREKHAAAALVRDAGLAFTVNLVVHRANLARLEAMIGLAAQLGAQRIEVAHAQYYGWGLRNRTSLLPSAEQLAAANATVAAARAQHAGQISIDYVPPDYYAQRPKACMGGWANRFFNVTPSGKVLPCHAAETLPGLQFLSVREAGLEEIWHRSPGFAAFRGTAWMAEPCRSCDRREIDWGGCRCQAFALTGDASRTDPACALAPDHSLMQQAIAQIDSQATPVFRHFSPS